MKPSEQPMTPRGGNTSNHLEIVLDSQKIATRVADLGREITRDYRDKVLTAVVVLKGSIVFAADLLRAIDLPLTVEFIGLRSYHDDSTASSGVVEITMDTKFPLTERDVLIVEDIVDTGLTVSYLKENLATRKPSSLRVAALLDKPARRVVEIDIDYRGFNIPDRYVVGYGLDLDGMYRNLPHLAALSNDRRKEAGG